MQDDTLAHILRKSSKFILLKGASGTGKSFCFTKALEFAKKTPTRLRIRVHSFDIVNLKTEQDFNDVVTALETRSADFKHDVVFVKNIHVLNPRNSLFTWLGSRLRRMKTGNLAAHNVLIMSVSDEYFPKLAFLKPDQTIEFVLTEQLKYRVVKEMLPALQGTARKKVVDASSNLHEIAVHCKEITLHVPSISWNLKPPPPLDQASLKLVSSSLRQHMIEVTAKKQRDYSERQRLEKDRVRDAIKSVVCALPAFQDSNNMFSIARKIRQHGAGISVVYLKTQIAKFGPALLSLLHCSAYFDTLYVEPSNADMIARKIKFSAPRDIPIAKATMEYNEYSMTRFCCATEKSVEIIGPTAQAQDTMLSGVAAFRMSDALDTFSDLDMLQNHGFASAGMSEFVLPDFDTYMLHSALRQLGPPVKCFPGEKLTQWPSTVLSDRHKFASVHISARSTMSKSRGAGLDSGAYHDIRRMMLHLDGSVSLFTPILTGEDLEVCTKLNNQFMATAIPFTTFSEVSSSTDKTGETLVAVDEMEANLRNASNHIASLVNKKTKKRKHKEKKQSTKEKPQKKTIASFFSSSSAR